LRAAITIVTAGRTGETASRTGGTAAFCAARRAGEAAIQALAATTIVGHDWSRRRRGRVRRRKLSIGPGRAGRERHDSHKNHQNRPHRESPLTRFRIGSCFRARTVFVEAGSPWVQGTQINTTRRNGGREVIAVRQPAPAAAWCQSQRLLKLRHRPAAADVQASQNPTPAIGRWPAWRVVDRSSTAVWGRLALRASPAWPKTMSSTRSSSSGHIGAWFSAPLWAVPSERTRSTDQ
jgi:hypothetical protein